MNSNIEPYWGKPTVRNYRGGAGNVMQSCMGAPALHSAGFVAKIISSCSDPAPQLKCSFIREYGKKRSECQAGH